MRRKLKNLKNKSGASQNGAPRALLDLAFYREAHNNRISLANTGHTTRYDSEYSGWSNPSRPRDQAVSLRHPIIPT